MLAKKSHFTPMRCTVSKGICVPHKCRSNIKYVWWGRAWLPFKAALLAADTHDKQTRKYQEISSPFILKVHTFSAKYMNLCELRISTTTSAKQFPKYKMPRIFILDAIKAVVIGLWGAITTRSGYRDLQSLGVPDTLHNALPAWAMSLVPAVWRLLPRKMMLYLMLSSVYIQKVDEEMICREGHCTPLSPLQLLWKTLLTSQLKIGLHWTLFSFSF